MKTRAKAGYLLLATLVLAACGSGSGGGGNGGDGGGGGGNGGNGGSGGNGGASASCQTGADSTLPGVSIEFTTTDCTYTVAEAKAGIKIDYHIVVAADVPDVYPVPQDGGGCGMPGPSGLIPFEKLAGGSESYCLCDVGLCPGPSGNPVVIPKGIYAGTFLWDGVNWAGPSDTNNPKGAPFPPGDYTLTVSAIGSYMNAGTKNDFSVSGTMPIHLVP